MPKPEKSSSNRSTLSRLMDVNIKAARIQYGYCWRARQGSKEEGAELDCFL